jgi:hypothetical protein
MVLQMELTDDDRRHGRTLKVGRLLEKKSHFGESMV